ncbi:cilia- and flagella-associated protein 77 [Esox lucius]|uniref:Cilia and flagella associated protein 77 n=1 Tax=Esox lucius TaxID=8010 RepID=A0A3P8XXD5_ESOLU|nr:cilia- and flagella-associated protein 77 [Esox lucius]XP_012992053.3 cilia- and flagella-associated protein 77 [Esox lucius]XP_019907696.3 cilia- and flagella-associated protein 77 [Esox lucius]
MQVSHVGVVRESMLANPLLIRPVLGKTKSNGLAFPGPDFVYGTVTTTQDGGVSEALSNWRAHSVPTSGCSSQSRRPEKDFVAMNREGVKSGLVTAKEHYQYRATQDRRRAAPARVRSHVPAPPRIPPDTTFGISTRPSTPIHELLEHKYAQLWLQEQKVKEKAREEDKLNKPKLGRIPETRTTLLRKSRPVPESAPLWKLPRFQQIGPALDTFRDPHARKKAFSAHLSDSVARRGQLGQGTYTMG